MERIDAEVKSPAGFPRTVTLEVHNLGNKIVLYSSVQIQPNVHVQNTREFVSREDMLVWVKEFFTQLC